MTVATSTNRVDYTGNGSTTVFPFSFRIFADTDLVVTTADADGVETELELTTDYTVSGAGSYNGGNVTLGTALTSGHTVTIQRVLNITQGTDLRNQGAFFAETHEDVFDRLVMIGQQLQEQIDRCAKLPVTNTTDTAELITDIVALADDLAKLTAVYNKLAEIETVADDLNEATSEIDTVATNIANVNIVGGISSDVTTVAGIDSEVSTVAGIDTEVTTVSGIAANVTTVAGISGNVTSVAGNASNINTVAGIQANVTTVAGISSNVSTVAGIAADVSTVAADGTDIGTVAGISSDVATVAAIAADVTAVANNDVDVSAVAADIAKVIEVANDLQEATSEIEVVANNIANVNTVGGISANVTTVAGISGDVTTVAGIAADVAAVENIAANVTTVAGVAANVTTVAGIAANVTTVAGNSANVTTVAGLDTEITALGAIASDITTAATNVADITNFADVYIGASATAPTARADSSALQAGDIYFNTSDDQMKVYTGSVWQSLGSTVNGTAARYKFVATASQTTFTGNDANGTTLAYDAGYIDVYLNGVHLDPSDYTATDGTSIVLASAAAADDELYIVGFGTFTLADVVGLTGGSTGAAEIPVGTTAQRPTGATGLFRFNSSLGKFEGYTGAAWGSVGGGATGGGSDDIFMENGQTVTTNYEITSGKNALSAGPITVDSGVTVTVPTGSRWVVV